MNRARTATPPTQKTGVRCARLQRFSLIAAVVLFAAVLVGVSFGRAQDPLESTLAPARSGGSAMQPTDLRDVNAWVAWMNARQIDALPLEARLFYRRGLIAHQAGRTQEALTNVRGAIQLDPSFLQPHITLANWSLFRDPAQMLLHIAAVIDLCRHDFNIQLDLTANALVLGIEALFAGLLFAGLFIVIHRRHELSHSLLEGLSRTISPLTARWWVPVILLLPFLAGAGLTIPVLAFLAFLWPVLRPRERVLTVLLATSAMLAPVALSTLDRFSLALRQDGRPFYEMPQIAHTPWSSERQTRLEHNASLDPKDGFAQFALAWHSRRGNQLAGAEQAYRAALQAWPEQSAVLTNLGNVVAMRGQSDEAIALYARAIKADAMNAAAHFNTSQLLTRRFEYTSANNEALQASAIDFELVKFYQSRAGTSGMLPLVDVWPSPEVFWHALESTDRPHGRQPLPLMLRGRMEAAGLPFTLVAMFAVALCGWFGRWQHARLPLRVCSNCGVIVCRRCAKRRREAALCSECDRIGAGAETLEFSRVLMIQHRARRRDNTRLGRTALAALVPGYGLLAHHHVFAPASLLTLTWMLGRLAFDFAAPFSLTPRLSFPGGEVPTVVLLAGLVVVYSWSLGGYLVVLNKERIREAQLDSGSRGRLTQSTRRQTTLAA